MPSPADACPYALLQVAPTASPQDLRQAFRRLSKRYHPDTTSLPEAEAALAFRQLQQAYALLSDPSRRQAYDARRRSLEAQAARTPASVAGSGATSSEATARRRVTSPRPVSARRVLSGGEWFALLLLALALAFSLVLGVGLAWSRGGELVRVPSWWSELQAHAGSEAAALPAIPPAPAPAAKPQATMAG